MSEKRDYVMARLAAAKSLNQTAGELLDVSIGYFVDPSEDLSGTERMDFMEAALDSAGETSRAIELAQSAMEELNKEEIEESELDEDEDEEGESAA